MHSDTGLRSVPQIAPARQIVIAAAMSAPQRARLTDSLRGRIDLHFVASLDELVRSLRSSIKPVDIVIIPARDSTGGDGARVSRIVAAERPRTAIVAYCDAGANHLGDIRALSTAGVHQFVFAGIDDVGVALRAVLDAARQQCAAEWVMSEMAPLLPAELRPMVEAALAHPGDITTIADLAAHLRVHRRTLFYRCERAGFVPPAELLTWTRLALVAYVLESTGCTVETIANQLSYPSVTALRNAIKRYTGFRASEIRAQQGIQIVLMSLANRLERLRNPAKALHSA